jgi:thioesterase domain-containing protein
MAALYLREARDVHPGGPWYLAGYCFGTLVAFEMAQQLLAQGEDVRMVAMFNGPSPAWIRRYGWYGNQPSQRGRHAKSPPLRGKARLVRALREPRRFQTALAWYLRKASRRWIDVRRAELALRLRRPLPERIREQFFLDLHARVERAYEPKPYPRDLIVFHGEGLYEDPELGWGGLADRGIATHAVPGEHTNNRQAMAEPSAGFIAERLQEYLAGAELAPDAGVPA